MDKIVANQAFDLGTQFYNEGKLEEAVPYYKKAVEFFQELDDEQKQADILLKIAQIQVELGRFGDAYKYYENSLKLFNKIDDYVGAGYSLAGLGMIHEAYNRYDEARNHYKKAIKIFLKAKDYRRIGIVFNLIGNTCKMQEKLEYAIMNYNKAIDIFHKLNEGQEEADILLKIAEIQVELGRFDDAYKYYENSLKLFNRIDDYVGAGYSLAGLGIITERHEKYEEARDYYEKAIKMFKKAKDYERMGIVSNLIANTYEIQDELEYALIDYKRSRELFEKLKDHSREAEVYRAMDRIGKERSKYKIPLKNILILIGYLVAISVAELFTTYFDMKVGLVTETAILFALLIHSSRVHTYQTIPYNYSNLLRAMMILPIVRIIGLSLPIMQIPTLYWFPIIAIPLFTASIVLMKVQGLNRKKVGLIWGNIPLQLIIGLSGIFLGFIEYFILKPAPLISTFDIVPLITAGFILIISTGFAEELLFRGILQINAENVMGSLFGLLYASLLFTSLHVGWHSFIDLAFVLGVALIYGYVFQKTRCLLGITLSHGISNSVLFLVMPFVVFNSPFLPF